ncbi:MAG: anthranilate synthase component I [Acidimicrobiales bacterium]|jgi:anthranilate synthase|nr:anthranilate synthase component I [Acidimicrobiales bacterium]|tara:strand:- start:441 stop:2591 length:2151 start_codon:yes stop_codon:yes gene_type:complete
MSFDDLPSYTTEGGVEVSVQVTSVEPLEAIEDLVDRLDSARGVLLSSSYEYPGRYTRWDMGFVDPPLVITSHGDKVDVEALNSRGELLLKPVRDNLKSLSCVTLEVDSVRKVTCRVERGTVRFSEEERSRQPSSFSVVRSMVELFRGSDEHLGLYGAFGYDLAFQFEPIELRLSRPQNQRDLVLYVPDEVIVVDHQSGIAERRRYEFSYGDDSTIEMSRGGAREPYSSDSELEPYRDHERGAYAGVVELAREYFARGDLFEVVSSQTFVEPSPEPPSELFRRLKEQNPSPYGFLINLGESEWLVGASPEMYVRVEGDRVETCPISGTIARGQDPLDDASQILALLNSEKDESELTMCTDVDRNDKSRICVPGSVKVIGRRQIEMYSRLIHTVDHVEGRLRPEFDALDAFLSHTWAVTVTGAPKTSAMMFLEEHEKSPRAWYGGAIGKIGFDGGLNTGLTLRTIRVKDGHAEVRVGATLLWDSDPVAEEEETELKASAFLDALRLPRRPSEVNTVEVQAENKRVLLVDHMDSFVHTLANYLRQTGAAVETQRAGFPLGELASNRPDLLVLSPGPGVPADFDTKATIEAALELDIPIFGVCLGLQAIVEYFGGELDQLETPMHGKSSLIETSNCKLFEGLPSQFKAGRYHSLYAMENMLPESIKIVAKSEDDNVVMAVEHAVLPICAVQFHPESIMSFDDEVGLKLVRNAVKMLTDRT